MLCVINFNDTPGTGNIIHYCVVCVELWIFKMAVFEEHYDKLTETIGEVDPNCFAAFAGKLYTKKIIGKDQKISAIAKD